MARPVARRGEGRERVLEAALRLFAQHGVSGTSLHMIADELGVTKAAVYFQFHTKEEIVFAVLQPALEQMATLVEAAQAQPSRAAQLDLTLTGLVDLVIDQRRITGVLHADPAAADAYASNATYAELTARLCRLLTGPNPTPAERVAVSMVGAGLMLIGTDPQLADLGQDQLRAELLRCARTLLVPATAPDGASDGASDGRHRPRPAASRGTD
jgi:AcrR family transcriptional regulator